MSKLGKLRKNAEAYEIDRFYKEMTPEQYKCGIQTAIKRTQDNMLERFEVEYNKLRKQYEDSIKGGIDSAIDTLSVELLYELANQMGFWKMEDSEENEYVRESIKERVQEIFTNSMNAIKHYADMKTENQARREFQKKKKQVIKYFKITF